MATHYGDFKNVESGRNGTIKGHIPFDGDGASAFRYRKVINVSVSGASSDSDGVRVSGTWLVRIRDSASVDANTHFDGTILFEQQVKWTADVTAIDIGGITLITWQPEGPAGSGEMQTSVVDGQECAVVENIYAPIPDELENYGQTGAWRFLDKNTKGITDDRAKYETERGYSTWEDEGVASTAGYEFYATYNSSDFICEIPEGAVFEVAQDDWRVGRLDPSIPYSISWKPGSAKIPTCYHPNGLLYGARKSDGGTVIESMSGVLGDKKVVSEIKDVAPIHLDLSPHNEWFYLLAKTTDGAAFFKSTDGAKTWTMSKPAFDSSYAIQDGELLHGGILAAIATKNNAIYFRASFDDGQTWKDPVLVAAAPSGVKRLSLRQAHVAGQSKLTITDFTTCRFDSEAVGAKDSWKPNFTNDSDANP